MSYVAQFVFCYAHALPHLNRPNVPQHLGQQIRQAGPLERD